MNINKNSEKELKRIRSNKTKGSIVFVSGTFSILHPGHLRLLRFAAECGSFLVVGVFSDRLATRSYLEEEMRLEAITAMTWVDHAFILDDSPQDFIRQLKPDVVVMGNEHADADNPEKSAVDSYGGKLMFGSGGTTFSSLQILKSETKNVDHSSIQKPNEFIERHQINVSSLDNLLSQIQSLNVCVIGDTIVDEYIQCDPLGMSQEDPTIVVTPLMVNKFLGGAGIVAAHAKSLGAGKVNFVSVTGDDNTSTFVREKLEEYEISSNILVDESRPTTLKQRYRAGNKTLLRVSHVRQHKINKTLQAQIKDHVFSLMDNIDLVIFSDFNYGSLPQELVDEISTECERLNIMMVADSQSSSQIGDVSRFKNTELLTPTEREARLALGNYEDGLVVLAESLRNKTKANNIAITLGSEGVLIHGANSDQTQWLTDRIPTLNNSPKDTAGAGDCLLVCTSMALVLGCSIWESLYLGSIAAACQVGRIGNIPLTQQELRIELLK
jgi:rfaE bifunctional protein kinase chain/domain|tara:strand:+ start:1710 stop:3200 length:1491 start_codon:yes stop_codon:yes gene_type:complete